MLKISRIKIRNFRSIVSLDLNVKRMNVFVGLNDVGKSNVLKALNLFFNSETEPGIKYDFDTDYSKYAVERRKQAKEIEITIVFEIPSNYKDHKDVEWTKKWRREGLFDDSSKNWEFSPYSKTPTLLRRVKYKYVPAVKSENYFKELLADLYVSIAREANEDLNTKADEYSESLREFTQMIGERVKQTVGINSNLTMPTNQVDIFKELIFMTNDESGKNISLSSRGDGIKAIHIPAILKYISEQDNKLMTNTSVPVTYIWGYEEPENGIEMKKCFELSRNLYDFSEEIQEFITTHSPAFYQLRNKEEVNVYYVFKNEKDYSSKVETNCDEYSIHDSIGILPLIAPFVELKKKELDDLQKKLQDVKFMDRDTVFVEGITDKKYLEMAISAFSPRLMERIQAGDLKIETRERNGCGTEVLVDWAIAWMHLNYTSKAIVLLDSDKAGKEALKKIRDCKNGIKKNKAKLGAYLLKESNELNEVLRIIDNGIPFTVEHLLSVDIWNEFVKKGWCIERDNAEMLQTYSKVMGKNMSLDEAIEKSVCNPLMRKTILLYKINDERKDEVLKMVACEVEKGNVDVLNGFNNTVKLLEGELLEQ